MPACACHRGQGHSGDSAPAVKASWATAPGLLECCAVFVTRGCFGPRPQAPLMSQPLVYSRCPWPSAPHFPKTWFLSSVNCSGQWCSCRVATVLGTGGPLQRVWGGLRGLPTVWAKGRGRWYRTEGEGGKRGRRREVAQEDEGGKDGRSHRAAQEPGTGLSFARAPRETAQA